MRYRLSWRADGALIDPAGGGWTDAAGQLRVDKGWLVTRGLQLVDCEDNADAPELAAARSVLGWALASPPAHAGHGGTGHETSVDVPWVEPLARPADTVIDVQPPASELRVCAVHWLVGRAEPDAVGLPEDAELGRTTLRLDDPGGAWLSTDLANGVLQELATPLSVGPDSAIEVVIERSLASLLTGADDPEAWGRTGLVALMSDVRVEVR